MLRPCVLGRGTLSVEEGEKTCEVGSHAVKAKVVGNSFFGKTKVKGGSGALSIKTVRAADM